MSYASCVVTYRRLCDQHKGDPEALSRVHVFGQEIAFMRLNDLLHSAFCAEMVIEKAKRTSRSELF